MYEGVYGVRYLLDTNVLIWYFKKNMELPPNIKKILDDADNTFNISIVSLWEIVIKMCLKKLDLGIEFEDFLKLIERNNIKLLPIKKEYLITNLSLSLHHRDPFDRLLIATAIAEKLPFITPDGDIHLYDIEWIW